MLGERDDDVALGQDAVDALAVIADHQRANAMLVQDVDRLGDRRTRLDCRDLIALIAQDRLEVHRGNSQAGMGRRRTVAGPEGAPWREDRTECRNLEGASPRRCAFLDHWVTLLLPFADARTPLLRFPRRA